MVHPPFYCDTPTNAPMMTSCGVVAKYDVIICIWPRVRSFRLIWLCYFIWLCIYASCVNAIYYKLAKSHITAVQIFEDFPEFLITRIHVFIWTRANLYRKQLMFVQLLYKILMVYSKLCVHCEIRIYVCIYIYIFIKSRDCLVHLWEKIWIFPLEESIITSYTCKNDDGIYIVYSHCLTIL